MTVSKDSKYTLNNGYQIPVSGLGVYLTPSNVASNIVYEALKAGYRHIDSARYYENEKESADGIARFLAEFPEVKRTDVFYTTKIAAFEPLTYEQAVEQIEDSYNIIKDKLGYIDLFLIHSPLPDKATRLNQYKALQEFVEQGKIKSIGVSNFGVKHLDELFAWEGLKIKPVVNQVELHPWLPRKDIQDAAKKYDLILEAYCPLTHGKKLDDPELVAIAKKHGKSPAEILLRWSYDQGFVPLAKTANVARLSQNYNVLDNVVLDDADMKTLDKPESYEVVSWDPTVHVDP